MKILYPWEQRQERRILLWQNPPIDAAVLRKARAPRSRTNFDRLVDLLASVQGRSRFRALMRDLVNGVHLRRAPRIVGVAR